jgi:hypothetical protein
MGVKDGMDDVLRETGVFVGRERDLRVVEGESSGEGRVTVLLDCASPMEENENCCGDADVTVALVLLKSAYGAMGSSASEPVLKSGLRVQSSTELSPKRLKSCEGRDEFRYESS